MVWKYGNERFGCRCSSSTTAELAGVFVTLIALANRHVPSTLRPGDRIHALPTLKTTMQALPYPIMRMHQRDDHKYDV